MRDAGKDIGGGGAKMLMGKDEGGKDTLSTEISPDKQASTTVQNTNNPNNPNSDDISPEGLLEVIS